MRKKLITASLLILTACGTAKVATSSMSQSDADRGAKHFNGLTLAQLNEGKALYETKCTLCHGLKNISSQSEKDWKEIVPEMAGKANMGGKVVIDAAAQELILKYVITMGPLNSSK